MRVHNVTCEFESSSSSNKSLPSINHSGQKYLQGSLQNGQVTQFYSAKLLRIESCLSFTVAINLLIIVVSESLTFPDLDTQNSGMVDLALSFNLVCLVIQMVVLYFRAETILALTKERKRIYEKATLVSTKSVFYLALEYLIVLPQPYSFLRGITFATQDAFNQVPFQLPINDLLSIFSLVRFYIVLRTLLLFTPYMNNRSNRLCKMYGCRADFSFSLKCLFKDSPLLLIGFFFIVSSLLFGYALYIAQRHLVLHLPAGTDGICNNYPNALWLIVTTITTVGYGDYFPHTPLGRLIILFVAVWGTFIVSIMVVVVANTLHMQKNEKRTLLILEKLTARDQLKKYAAKMIGYFILFKRAKRSGSDAQERKYSGLLRVLKKEFSECRKKIKLMNGCDDIYDEIATHFLNLNSDIEILNKNQENIINYIHENLQYNEQTSKK